MYEWGVGRARFFSTFNVEGRKVRTNCAGLKTFWVSNLIGKGVTTRLVQQDKSVRGQYPAWWQVLTHCFHLPTDTIHWLILKFTRGIDSDFTFVRRSQRFCCDFKHIAFGVIVWVAFTEVPFDEIALKGCALFCGKVVIDTNWGIIDWCNSNGNCEATSNTPLMLESVHRDIWLIESCWIGLSAYQ